MEGVGFILLGEEKALKDCYLPVLERSLYAEEGPTFLCRWLTDTMYHSKCSVFETETFKSNRDEIFKLRIS